jgi:hypothetical protein
MCTKRMFRCLTNTKSASERAAEHSRGQGIMSEMENCIRRELRMICFVAKERVQEGLARGFVAAASRLDGDKDGINLG